MKTDGSQGKDSSLYRHLPTHKEWHTLAHSVLLKPNNKPEPEMRTGCGAH